MADDVTSQGLVESLVTLFSTPRHARAAHSKGICCAGVYRATPDAAALTRAEHMAGRPVPVTARFSNGVGNPAVPDGFPGGGRGLAVRFHLPGNRHTDLLSITTPLFPARVPQDFIELTVALRNDPATGQPDPRKIEAFKHSHPRLRAAVDVALTPLVPASYAQIPYWAVHAFRFTNAHNEERYVRYSWQPDAGRVTFPPDKAPADPSYLQAELRDRLAEQAVVFTLHLQLAERDDDVNDPATAWPAQRRRVLAGTLEITSMVEDQQDGCEALIFDPSLLTDGIDLSDDPILRARPGAYSVSFTRRTT
jgi:catalase